MFCQFCGTVLTDTARFCKSCGKATGEGAPILTPALPKPQPAPPKSLRPAVKWGVGLAAGFIALVTYLATRATSPSSIVENINGIRLEMVRVPGGSFMMGSRQNEEGRDNNEGPQRRVIVQSFYIGKYEVTQAQWKAVMGSGNNSSDFKGDDLPVGGVMWYGAKEFCQKLSVITGNAYRLPSEAEWEYACRAGTTGDYAGNLDAMAWHGNNSGGKPHPIGQKQPNAFGLYDMHGNVQEWCEDVWHDDYNGAPTDGSAWLSDGDSRYRPTRGGSWPYGSAAFRSADRVNWGINDRSSDFGFRVAMSARTQ